MCKKNIVFSSTHVHQAILQIIIVQNECSFNALHTTFHLSLQVRSVHYVGTEQMAFQGQGHAFSQHQRLWND